MSNKLVKLGSLKGPKGDPGFTLKGEISSLSDLEDIVSLANLNPPKINDAWVLNPNYDDSLYNVEEKHGAVWVYRGEDYEYTEGSITYTGGFEYVTNLRGPKGEVSQNIHFAATYNDFVTSDYYNETMKVGDAVIDNGEADFTRMGNMYKIIDISPTEDITPQTQGKWIEATDLNQIKQNSAVIIVSKNSEEQYFAMEKEADSSYEEMNENCIFLNPGVWNVDNAKFAIYYFNSDGTNSTNNHFEYLVKLDGSDIYYTNLEEGWTNCIFVRVNSACGEEITWEYVWNQTSDLIIPASLSESNMLTITGWSQNENSWGKYIQESSATRKINAVNISNFLGHCEDGKLCIENISGISDLSIFFLRYLDTSTRQFSFYDTSYSNNASIYCVKEANIKIGPGDENNEFIFDSNGYFKNIDTGKWIGVYNNQDWRGYTSNPITDNSNRIKGQTFKIFEYIPGNLLVPSNPKVTIDTNNIISINSVKPNIYYGGKNIEIVDQTTINSVGYTWDSEKKSFSAGENINTATGNYSFSEGNATEATGDYSHAEGNSTHAEGYYSHAEGDTSHAKGAISHAEGFSSYAEGHCSHAEGGETNALGNYSHTEGIGTTTSNEAEHAEGKYNVSNDSTRSSIGIGTSETDRKNAVEVMDNGDMYVYGLGDYDGTNPETATTLQQCINEGSGSQSFGGYVYIEKYDKTNFENALTTALAEAKTEYDNSTNKNAIILDCTYFTGTHVLSDGFTGFNLETPVKLVFGSIKVVFNNPGDNNLFNILHNDISIVGINRNTDASQIATEDTAANGATLFIMNGDGNNSSDNLNGYHIKSSGFKNILIDSITLRGKRSAMGEYYQSTNYPISGIGGIYIEKGDPSGTATSGLTCNNVRINNVLISETKAHGIYINTPILSSITNTRLSGCGGHGIYILGGTSINMENVYASSGNFAGFCIQNASYVQLANCVAETFGIGFLIRGSNSVTLHCPGVEQTSNFGRFPWRNTLTTEKTSTSTNSNSGIYGLGLLHTGTTNIIKDVVSDLESCFIGYGIYITGGDGINVFSPYIKSIGQSKSGTLGYTNSTTPSDKLNFISVVGTANLINIINPHFKMSDGDSTIISTIKNEIKIGENAKYVDISYSTDSSPLKENVEGVLKYTTSSSDKACIYTVDGENGNIDTITLKIDNVYESLFAKTMYAENGFYETSDARKKDIQGELPLDKAYDFIRNCEPILYNLKGSDKTQIGLIAQEVSEFFPEIVNKDNEGYLSLDYAKLTVVILRVLKDLIDTK